MVTKNINVKVNIIGNVPDGYLCGEPSVSPSFLSVTAPQDVIDTIKECRIDLYLDDIRRSLSEYRQAHIIYTNGTIESDLKGKLISIENNNVKLDLAVREGYPEKTVNVKVELLNKPPEGRKLESCTPVPDKINITGSAKLLEKIEDITLEQVDLEKVLNSSSLRLQAKLPKGIKAVGSDYIMLNIKYANILISKSIHNLPLEVTHDEEQLVEYDITTYTVELEGYIDDINAIKPLELKNIVCVKGLSSGTHQISLEIPYGFSDRVKVKSIQPVSIPLTIRLLEKVEENPSGNESEKDILTDSVQNISSETKELNPEITIEQSSLATDSSIIIKPIEFEIKPASPSESLSSIEENPTN